MKYIIFPSSKICNLYSLVFKPSPFSLFWYIRCSKSLCILPITFLSPVISGHLAMCIPTLLLCTLASDNLLITFASPRTLLLLLFLFQSYSFLSSNLISSMRTFLGLLSRIDCSFSWFTWYVTNFITQLPLYRVICMSLNWRVLTKYL